MKQILQDVKSGETKLVTVPPPMVRPGFVKVRTGASLISAGTEKMMIDLAKKSLIGKARARPDLVRLVIDKAKREGLTSTYQTVRTKLENAIPLGYSAAGIVSEVGEGIEALTIGDRVAVGGAGYANHAEVNVVPANLVVPVPDNVPVKEACYGTVGSIALQGVRLAEPGLSEQVAVIGLGLLGLLTVQILKANGCRVIGIDLDETKVKLAGKLGLDEGVVASIADPVQVVDQISRGRGVDITIITAATNSNGPISTAGEITRRKGRVVVVGAVGMDIPRDTYYKKELDIRVSMSYGPGRYDPTYEEGGIDYPYDYVRWTEQRNLEAVLSLISDGKLDVRSITTHEIPFERALDAYKLINDGSESYVGVVLTYGSDIDQDSVVRLHPEASFEPKDQLRIGFVGAGNYADIQLLPHLKKNGKVHLAGLMSATGHSAQQKAQKYGFEYCTSDVNAITGDPDIDAIFIATRHRTHADYMIRALESGKHVFVEKPLVVSPGELQRLATAYLSACAQHPVCLMVGLNRRFAPMVAELKSAFSDRTVMQMIYRVNSGYLPNNTWLHDEAEGGGMLIGEMCHFFDLLQHISGETPTRVYAQTLQLNKADTANSDNISISITFDKGSVGTICYNTVGDKSAPKERLEVYGGGTVAVLDDFRRLEVVTGGKRRTIKAANQDKGQSHMLEQTVLAMRSTGRSPISFSELLLGMQVIFAARESSRTSSPVSLDATHETAVAGKGQ